MTVKVTVNPAPSAASAMVTEPPLPDDVVVDSKGRRIKLKEPEILQESRLVKIMGEASMNAAYMSTYVMPAAMVVAIDDVEFGFPNTEREVEAAIQRLGRHGLNAVMNQLMKKAQDAEAQKNDIKNS